MSPPRRRDGIPLEYRDPKGTGIHGRAHYTQAGLQFCMEHGFPPEPPKFEPGKGCSFKQFCKEMGWRYGDEERTSTWLWPLKGVPIKGPSPAGCFGYPRKFDVHTGVDLYCDPGQEVVAVEPGTVVTVEAFTGPEAESPWWNPTWAVLVEGASGVVVYGEVEPLVVEGQQVAVGMPVGHVLTVLKKDKGLPMTMLHLELMVPGSRSTVWWPEGQPQPECLLDPTPLLAFPKKKQN